MESPWVWEGGVLLFGMCKHTRANENLFFGARRERGRRGKMGSGAGGEKRRAERSREKDGQKVPGEKGGEKGWPKRAEGSWGVEEGKKIIKIKWGTGWPKSAEGNVGVCVWGGAEQVTSRMRTLGHGPVWSNRASGFIKSVLGWRPGHKLGRDIK